MFIYNIFIRFYGLAILIASLFNDKAKKWVKGRKKASKNWPEINDENVAWFHCASLGEFEQALTVIDELKSKYFILITFFSPSGYEQKKNFKDANYICYLPLDTPKNAKKFLKHFKPKKAFFVKYEFWLNYIKQAEKQSCKLYSLSTLMRKNQVFFKWYGGIFRSNLKKFSHFFVQNEETKNLLNSIKIHQVSITGDTRYDRVIKRKNNIRPNKIIQNWIKEEKAWVIGSSWKKDEEICVPIVNNTKTKVIIAPHEINDRKIKRLTQSLHRNYFQFSKIISNEVDYIPDDTEVLVLDCIGYLAEAYYFGKYAYVGGGFGTGLHNILEPAAFNLPVIFGPIHVKFPEAKIFIEKGIGFSVENSSELEREITDLEENKSKYKEKVSLYMQKQAGASEKVLKEINFTTL